MTAWIPNVVPDEPIESAWGNLIRDRTVTPFANVAARTAALAAPAEGMISYLADTGALEIYYGATVGWRPPWNVAWGEIGRTVNANVNQGSITAAADINGTTLTVAVVAGRRYAWDYHVSARSAYELNMVGAVSMTDHPANVIISWCEFSKNTVVPIYDRWIETATATANLTRKLRIQMVNGATTVGYFGGAVVPIWLACHDIGPAANPA